jgi:iron complex outermembrane receptor protein
MPSYRRSLSLLDSSIASRLALAAALAAGLAAGPAMAAEEVGEVVVTVRQRAESVQDVPGTVSVISAADIEAAGVQRARDFIALTPGVSIVNAAEVADSQVNIRGINGARDAETNYALIIDGILMTNPAALNREYSNLQQVEILKGPQGAIYGRNAAAGAFVITTKKPGEEFGGDVKASYAQDDTYLVSANIGGPATETLKWSLTGDYRDSNGFYANKAPDPAFPAQYYPDPGCDDCVDYFQDWNVAGRLIWEPSENMSVDTKLRYGEVDAGAITFNSVFHLGALAGVGPGFYENVNDHEFGFNPNIKPFNNQDSTEFSVKMDYDLGWSDLTAWGLYSNIENAFGADGTSGAFGFFNDEPRCEASTAALTGFPLNAPQFVGQVPEPFDATNNPTGSLFGAYTPTSCDGTQYQVRNQEDISFEVRLTSKSDQRLRWQGGLYYLNIDREVGINLGVDDGIGIVESLYVPAPANPGDPSNYTQQLVHDDFGTDVYAVFGSIAYDVTDTIEASFALRYDREERDVHNRVPTDATTPYVDTCFDNPFIGTGTDATPGSDPINPALCTASSIPDKSATFDQWEPKVSLTWDAMDNLTAFATIGVGFKSGGFNSQGSQATVDGFINNIIVDTALGAPVPVDCGDPTNGCSRVNISDDYREETSTSYEVGVKSNWLDNKLRAEAAYYHTDVDDMQFFEFFVGSFGLLRVVSNIDQVSIDGVEIGQNWAATDWMELYAGANFIDSNIDENAARPDTVGNESPYTPEWTASLGAHFNWPMSEGLALIADVDANAVGDTWFHVVQDQERPIYFTRFGFGPGEYSAAQRDAYTLVNARLGLAGEQWSVVAFGRNIFDESYVEEVIPAPEFGGSFIHAGSQSRFGVEATYKF